MLTTSNGASIGSSIIASSKPLLECQKLSCERNGRVLFSQLDLCVEAGDILQIEGPNGCGKTTLLRALTTLLSDFSGEIYWRGHSIRQARSEYLADLLLIGHLPGVKKTLSPRENLRFLCGLHSSSTTESIDAALEKVGLYDGYEDMPGHQLSAGQLRRVALARLYLSQAPIWILDEPYTAIDKQGVVRLEQQFTDHASAGGCVILTTHQSPSIANLKRIPLHEYAPQFQQPSSDFATLEEQGGEND